MSTVTFYNKDYLREKRVIKHYLYESLEMDDKMF